VDSLPEIVESDGKSARTYASEVRKTIENADILIEVFYNFVEPRKQVRIKSVFFHCKMIFSSPNLEF